MKKATLIVCLAMVMVMGLASVAFANTNSGYLGTAGSPHGSYTTASKKCGVCHAVHKATASGEVLMRGTVSNACVYCHIQTAAVGRIVLYAGTDTNYTVESKFAHGADALGGVSCVQCHTPHGATTLIADNVYLREKILRGATPQVAPAVGDLADVAVSKWCTNCHNTTSNGGQPYYETHYDGSANERSHIMKGAPLTSYAGSGTVGAVQVAWTGSETCRSCHADGSTNASNGSIQTIASSYPHFTTGQRFLTAAGNDANSAALVSALDSEADGVCIRCHVSAGSGSGLTY